MQLIQNKDIPKDYNYYRSHSKTYFEWIIKNAWSNIIKIEEKWSFGYIKNYFWWFFSTAHFEKSTINITNELLNKYWMNRGLIFWSWWSNQTLIKSDLIWLRLWAIFSWNYHHSFKSSFSILDNIEYWKKWQNWAKWHRNKIIKYTEEWRIEINTNASIEEFINIYSKTKVNHYLKNYLISRQRYLYEKNPESFRIYLAYIDWIPCAWAIFIDDFPTSTYLIAFQNIEWKKYHLWLAIIDKWFSESLLLWFKYLDFDHMKSFLDPQSYNWYTKFKSSFADFEINFKTMWIWFKFNIK